MRLLSLNISTFSPAACTRHREVCPTTFPSPSPARKGSFPRCLGEIGLNTACNRGSHSSRNRMEKLHAHRARGRCQTASLATHREGLPLGLLPQRQRTLTGSHAFMVYIHTRSFSYNSPFAWISTPDVRGGPCGPYLAVTEAPAPQVT